MALVDKVLSQDWLNQNQNRAYPLDGRASQLDVTGTFLVPNDLLVDMILVAPSALAADAFFLSRLTVGGNTVRLVFSNENGEVARLSVAAEGFVDFSTYTLTGEGDLAGHFGRVTVGSLATILKFGGDFTFDLDGGKLLDTIIRPAPTTLYGLQVISDAEVSEVLSDVITLREGNNIRLRVVDNDVFIDALVREGLNQECGCPNDITLPPPLRTINGVGPLENGAMTFSPNTCMEITSPQEATIQFGDTCSRPCCSSEELKTISTDLNSLNVDARGLRQMATQIESDGQKLMAISVLLQSSGLVGTAAGGGVET